MDLLIFSDELQTLLGEFLAAVQLWIKRILWCRVDWRTQGKDHLVKCTKVSGAQVMLQSRY